MESLLVFTLSFILINYFILNFAIGYFSENKIDIPKIKDTYQLGYIELDNKLTKLEKKQKCPSFVTEKKEIKELKTQIENLNKLINNQNKVVKKEKSIPVSTNIKPTNTKLYDECVQSLVVLGTKKKTAKEEVDKYFINHQVNTVEEFINNFFKDRHDKSSRPN